MEKFAHLHVHTQFSILDGASKIPDLIAKAKADDMPAVAITDHGNMFGVKEFFDEAKRQRIKPIIGCEVYVAKTSRKNQKNREDRAGDHLILLAKNETGYHNLVKMVSLAWIEGHYYKPRVDKELLREYSEGIICSSACLGGEVPQAILNHGQKKAEEVMLEYREIFGEDYYLELQRHKTGDPEIDEDVYVRQEMVNKELVKLAQKHNIPYIATNDVHFINAEDADAHDILICLNTGSDLDDPSRLRYTKQEYFKTRQEMAELFEDLPEALENTGLIVDKIEDYKLNREPILPVFPLPEGFDDEDEYLRHITYQGAEKRYAEITDEIRSRIDFELGVIKRMGFPGYFLIVQDFLNAARKMDVSVGPGRGSAAGSVVAYCTRITDIDPRKYNLLFERFLNPDRISMPDIDIDFDEDGRELVLEWVVEKYGKDKVAQIITFGTMAAKMAIRDVGRVQKLPLSDADRLAKLVPERPGINLAGAYKEVPALQMARNSDNHLISQTLKYADTLEGSVRQSGLHACGIIIGRENLIDHVPVCTSKETNLLVTQYDGKHIEEVGMLKMDFLGLKTLSIIKDAIENIELSTGEKFDLDAIPLDDATTFELYSRGETTGLFQFESDGMKKHLRELKPNRFEDLIAMNALYRPGPMEYIPSFINRKHGSEEINYDLPIMEEFLKDTYGITVYQEQVMQLSQAMAGFTGGEADSLRKAMGKKKKKVMDEMKEKFMAGSKNNGYSEEVSEKVWHDWEAFAQYAFNKSHSTCYAFVSYQTGYLKAHYPAEFMAAVLSRNINDIKKITIFMDETKRMGMNVLGPDIHESNIKFTVNKDSNIRFGLGAIKGVGESASQCIIDERANGPFKDIYDFVERINLTTVNKKNLEALAASGAFDCFSEISREQYFQPDAKDITFIEHLVRYGNKFQNELSANQPSLFGGDSGPEMLRPLLPVAEDWSKLEKLNKEKDLVGIYLSAHPLDDYRLEIENFCNTKVAELNDLKSLNGRDTTIAGIVTGVRNGTTKTGRPFGILTVQDYTDSYRIPFFGSDYIDFSKFFAVGYFLLINGKVQPKPFNKEELEFKVKSINILSDVRDEIIKSITLKIPVSSVDDEFMEGFETAIGKKRGNIRLKFVLFDPHEKISVDLFSRSIKVRLTDDLVNFLEQNKEVEYSVK